MDRTGPEDRKKKKKSPSRLQQRAPAALQLEGITMGKYDFKEEEDGSSGGCAIPLLSPLILSPLAEVAGGGGEVMEIKQGRTIKTGGFEAAAMAEGWQHPAIGAMIEPSNLGALIQSQCVLSKYA